MSRVHHRRNGSLVHQTKQALQSVFEPGTSRHDAKQAGVAGQVIVSIGTLRSYLDTNVVFGRWCKAKYGIGDMAEITPTMGMAHLRYLHVSGYSLGYINKVQCGIRHLDNGLRKLGAKPSDAPPLLGELPTRHSDPRPTPLTSSEADRVIADLREQVDPTYADLAQLQRVAGLRLSEAVNLSIAAIARDGSTITLEHNAHTKGGRPRLIVIEETHRGFLALLRERSAKLRDGHVFDGRRGLARQYQRQFAAACRRYGILHSRTHDLRATYAQETLAALVAQGKPGDDAKWEVSRRLGHGRVDVIRHYIGSGFYGETEKAG